MGNAEDAVVASAPEDLPQDQWEKEWEGLKAMGGCAMVPQAEAMGITCATDLSKHPAINASAPGIQGSLCDKCAASCLAAGQTCSPNAEDAVVASAPDDLPEDQWEKEWEGLKAMGGCAMVPQAEAMGI